MKFKDYYKILGLERNATADQIKQAYRKLAHKYHPDISKDAEGEAKFKEVAEAYATLKDPDKRAEYDRLGRREEGAEFEPPPDWQDQFSQAGGASYFGDVDLADLLAAMAAAHHPGAQRGAHRPRHGEDYEVTVPVTLEQIYRGSETDVSVSLPETDEHGLLHRVPHTFRVAIPKGAADGQKLRLPGKGGHGSHGGKAGDLYVVMQLRPHPLYRVSGKDLYIDLPLAPWEAVLGGSVQVPTLGGTVEINVAAGSVAGRKLRLAKRGLPGSSGEIGDLFAVVRIEVPKTVDTRERELFAQLAAASSFNPRAHLFEGGKS